MRSAPRGLVVALTVLLWVQVAVIVVVDVPGVRPPTFVTPVDGWLQGLCFATAAALCWVRVLDPHGRALWTWVALALTCRAFAFGYYFAVVRSLDPQPYPSVSDLFWLATVVLLMAGLVTLVRDRFSYLTRSLVFDGVTGVVVAGAVAVALLFDTLVARTGQPGTPSVVVTNLAYPVLDIMLVLLLLGALVGYAWQPPLPIWGLAVGLLGFVVTDAIFLVQVTAGTFHPGTPLSSFTVLTNAVIATAGFLPDRTPTPRQRDLQPNLVLPAVFATLGVALLVYATVAPVPLVSVLLAGAAVLVALVRTGLAFRTVRRAAEHGRGAGVDELTGLPNRRAFNDLLTETLQGRATADPLGLLIIDLDDFKAVNDTLGHHNGDALLRLVAARLHEVLRDGDVLARIGGDEFAVVLPGADAERAGETAERLRAALRRPFPLAARDLDVLASVGIAVFPADGREPVPLLQHADLAMYEAKVARTGQSYYRPEPHHASLARLETVDRLRQAILGGEMLLHYQPVVDLGSGQVVGVEALVRWQHPEEGLLPPSTFLPLAESGGLMRELTPRVLDLALRQGRVWLEGGQPLSIAVNMSVTNLLDVGFPEQVAAALDATGFPGTMLDLELTEDLFMADPDRARRVIRDLLGLGVRLVVDDYGTGYSSLGYLRDLHEVSGLKLDRTFVSHLPDDTRAAAIVGSTVTLATSLGLKVVAEGVESRQARDRLGELGCSLAQGYLFSPPVPADRVPLTTIGDVPGPF
ncbi:MAG: EAL domain-containing protein [Nocardioidaceae bacterium]|nr:EAL domain-containing protein [Nocardioidaceae bacterium]